MKLASCLVLISLVLAACDAEEGVSAVPDVLPSAADVLPRSDVQGEPADVAEADDVATEPDLAEPDDVAIDEVGEDTPPIEDVPPPDAGEDTREVGINPFGEVTGACESVLDPLDDTPAVVINTFVFDGDPFDPGDLSDDAEVLFDQPNAGGSSKCSEVFSLEVMRLCAGADLYKAETEIVYDVQGSLTDYAVTVAGERVGVSVTRAYKGPVIDVYSAGDATALLEKKLEGVNESTANVSAADAWQRQVLHVWTLHPEWADTVAEAWAALDPALKADTLVLITVETGSDFVVSDACDD